MENLNIKVQGDKVHIGYTCLYDPEESFYEEFNKEKLNGFKENHFLEIQGESGKLNVFCKDGSTHINYSRPGRDISLVGKNLCRELLSA
jgi:hypothetical protein